MGDKDRKGYGPHAGERRYSEAAFDAALQCDARCDAYAVHEVADAMHDLALGLDRSVRLRPYHDALVNVRAILASMPVSPRVLRALDVIDQALDQ